ncbi:MAG TPA: hypothetical protein PLH72_10280 [Vicinamibacterales bacterium]|nr:hypothetical protein [Vicinamibacterales bacterium]
MPPENGVRSSAWIAWSVPESQSKISPDAFLAASMQKIPNAVIANQPHDMSPCAAAAHAPTIIDAADASVIFGSARR